MSLTKVTYSMVANAPINVIDFGAVGDGAADDTAALQSAFNAGTNIYLGGSDKSYLISDEIIVQSNTTVFGEKPTITQTANLTPIFNIDGKDNINVFGIKFVGVGTDFVNNDATPLADAIYTDTGSSNLFFKNNEFINFGYAGLRLKAATNVQVVDNIFVGPGAPILTPIVSGSCYGILTDTGCKNVIIGGNLISKYAQGLRVEGTEEISIVNNIITDIVGQHGMYIGSQMQNVTVSGNTVLRVDLIGIKVQAQNGGNPNKNISITGNTVTDCVGDGISITHGDGAAPQVVQNENVTISGNALSSIGAYAILVQNCNICIVGNNSINVCGTSGVIISASNFVDISNNAILNAQLSGIRDQFPCAFLSITDNTIRNVAIADIAGDNFGIFIQDGTALEISSNIISDAAGGMFHGIYVAGGTQSSQSIFNNQVFESSDTAIRFASASTSIGMFKDNLLIGTNGAAFNNTLAPVVASATTISLPTAHDVVTISGTATINLISVEGHSGHIVTLIFQAAATVTDGSNLVLSGNFTASADDCLTLACNGLNWYEVSRSLN